MHNRNWNDLTRTSNIFVTLNATYAMVVHDKIKFDDLKNKTLRTTRTGQWQCGFDFL